MTIEYLLRHNDLARLFELRFCRRPESARIGRDEAPIDGDKYCQESGLETLAWRELFRSCFRRIGQSRVMDGYRAEDREQHRIGGDA